MAALYPTNELGTDASGIGSGNFGTFSGWYDRESARSE
jgi:hypothetical protein